MQQAQRAGRVTHQHKQPIQQRAAHCQMACEMEAVGDLAGSLLLSLLPWRRLCGWRPGVVLEGSCHYPQARMSVSYYSQRYAPHHNKGKSSVTGNSRSEREMAVRQCAETRKECCRMFCRTRTRTSGARRTARFRARLRPARVAHLTASAISCPRGGSHVSDGPMLGSPRSRRNRLEVESTRS